jgi:hypothetical protein
MNKTEKFIEKSKVIHLDKYDYSNTIYINNYSKVEIICKEHGSFFSKTTISFSTWLSKMW